MNKSRELGKITSTMLGIEDHGILSFNLCFDFGGSMQCFGGYCLDSYDKEKKERVGHAFGTTVIRQILETVGVDKWEKLVGKEMWVIRNDKPAGWSTMIVGIEPPAYRKTARKRFMIKELAKEFFPEEDKKW